MPVDRYDRRKSPSLPEWKRRNALGLPPGSIRALLALTVAATVWGSLVLYPDRETPAYLRDLMFIILGHYFAARGRSRGEHAAADRSGSGSGAEPATPPPLFLPQGSVRLILVAGFLGVAVYLFGGDRIGPIARSPAAVTLMLIGGFLLGALFKALTPPEALDKNPEAYRLLEDLKATLALLSAVVLVALTWDQASPWLPDDLREAIPRLGQQGPEHLASVFIGFYFGSR